MTIREIIHDTELKMKKTVEATQREFATVRTGRASSGLVEGIRVDYYGTATPLKQLAAISTPDAKLIVIQPWDKTVLAEVEKSILKSEIGITPTNDGKVIRLSIPSLTDERRAERRVIHVGVTRDENDIASIPAALVHFLAGHGQRGRHGEWLMVNGRWLMKISNQQSKIRN